tara:strand:+ start:69 stop:497 length:429 start_codon:yes stop_codon:yes gene_type:complete
MEPPIINVQGCSLDSSKNIVVDIDGVICECNAGDYASSNPLPYGIKRVNELYDRGFYIILLTARYGDREFGNLARQYQRGFIELVDWLKDNNVKYNEVRLGKPPAMLYIDDKAARVEGDSEDGWSHVSESLEKALKKDKYGQ